MRKSIWDQLIAVIRGVEVTWGARGIYEAGGAEVRWGKLGELMSGSVSWSELGELGGPELEGGGEKGLSELGLRGGPGELGN